jgi:hypothetical protein
MLDLLAGEFLNFDPNARALGQFPDCSGEFEVLVIHHEPEHGAPGAAAETLKYLAGGVDRKGGAPFLVEGAESFVGRARTFEREIRTNHLHDVVRGGNLLDEFL